MNRALPEMLQYFFNNAAGNCADMTVLERQRARIKCQQEQQLQQLQNQQNGNSFFNGSEFGSLFSLPSFQGLMGEVITGPVKPSSENGWPELGKFELPGVGLGVGSNSETVNVNGFEPNSAISRTSSCPPAVVVMVPEVAAKGTESVPSEKLSSAVGRESFKKRKADKMQNTKVVSEDDSEEKKIKVCTEEGESKITDRNSIKNNREASGETSKENSKASEVQKPDYIHVRARRGQATDSHSLAERVRREKISERMKYLQDLVPGCNKITGKAGMLDEIINYVQSLQRQVEFLSMKLAAVNPRLDFNVEDLFSKEAFPACTTNFPAVGISPEMTNSSNYIQFNPSAQQMVSICGMEMGLNPSSDLGLRRSISAQVSIPETFLDSTFFTQFQPTSAWDSDVQNLVNSVCDPRRSATAFSTSQPFTGSIEASNLKTEM